MKWIKRSFSAEGLNLERLIRRAAEQGLELRRISRSGRRMTGQAAEKEIPALEKLAREGGWGFSIGSRTGFGAGLDRISSRRFLISACVLALLTAIAGTQLLWYAQLVNAGAYEGDMRLYLEEVGVVPGALRKKIDTGSLRDQLEWRYPDVAWIEVGWRGMTLEIRVFQGVALPDGTQPEGGYDVVAARDGIVTGIVTAAGTPLVQAGEIVRKGQVLIKGEERTGLEETRPVAARGRVTARVWDAYAVTMNLSERQTVYTGRTFRHTGVSTPWFPLLREKDSGFAQQDTSVKSLPLGGLFLPAVIEWRTDMEAEVRIAQRPAEAVEAEAGLAAMRKLREKVGRSDDFVDKWVDYSMIDSEEICAVAYAERIIDIAVSERDTQ
ncbi:MAG: sporulation protein YqfD [Clostridia bacterium]|nr:sporulation protein YqfD [Clostridia bacterium]